MRFRLGLLARFFYPVCRVLFGSGAAPGLAVFFSDLVLYGFVAFVCVRVFFLPSFHRSGSSEGVAAVADYRSSVVSFSAGSGGLPAGGSPAGGLPAGGSPACRVFCPAGVDCELLSRLNPGCEVYR